MRFPEFQGEWEETLLENVCIINPKTSPLRNEFIYIDLESVVKGQLININHTLKSEAPSRAQRVLQDNDILFQCVRPYQLNNYVHKQYDSNQWVASTGYAQIRTSNDTNFLYQLLNSPMFNKEVMLRCTGSSYPAISSSDLGKISIVICSKKEQEKIGLLLSLIDERISTQIKIIEDLRLLKIQTRHKIFSKLENFCSETKQIKDILDYEQPTSYIVENTDYCNDSSLTPVLTANKAFILGYTNEKNGIYDKGNCIIFDDFTMDMKYVDFSFKVKSSAIKILKSKQGINLKYMFEYISFLNLKSSDHKRHYISEIEPMYIPIPRREYQDFVANLFSAIDKKTETEFSYYNLLLSQKQYLLQQMFI